MTVFMSALVRYQDIDLNDYEIAAFCGDECRGIMSTEQVSDIEYGYLRIRSNNTSGESISFKLYDKNTSQEIASDSIVSFISNSRIGYPSETYKINFGGYIINATSVDNEKGTVSGSGEYGLNSEVSLLATPNTGYHFDSWSDGVTENPYVFQATMNLDLTASFSPNQYTITFDTDGGSEIAPITQDYNSTVTAPADPTKTGYTFVGWDKDIPATMPAENITIKALWTINNYKLTYKVDDEVYKQYVIEYNTAITPEAAPDKEGHTFSGWSEVPETMPAYDVEVTGTFSVNQYKVTFISEGVVVKEEILNFGTAITAPEDPTKVGHTFIGWDPEVDATVPSHDVTYTAQFSINTYKLTYFIDGDVYKEYEVDYGTVITPEEAPTKDDFNFSGWSEIPETMPDHDVNVYGTFETTTSIVNIKADTMDSRIYNISGKVLKQPQKGINIINGKKVLVK